MKTGIIGLGLMGASFAKTLHKNACAQVYGIDTDQTVMQKARELSVIDEELTTENASQLDMLMVALYPRQFRDALLPYLPHLKEGAIVTDCGGNKRIILREMQKFAKDYPQLVFVGAHPMAGLEVYGIDNAIDNLFDGASVILVPCNISSEKLQHLGKFYLSLGFGKVVCCTAENHDAVVAYTSQLCHVVSNAFIKNKTAELQSGYSAGSFLDLTRVAKMNSRMWAELMIDNRDMLSAELDELITNLQKYNVALKSSDEDELQKLLEEGNQRKLQINS